jgi:TRAP-type C4-dicarboxylate transport system permease small subunit
VRIGETQEGPVARLLHVLCVVSAVMGGVVLIAMALMTVVSVIGRAWFSAPILGDVELVQLGIAVCIASFLPYTQFERSNIIVDFFTTRASNRARGRMDGLGTLLYTLVMALVAWRVFVGGAWSRESQETSMLMSLPMWTSYMLMVPGLALSALVGMYQTVLHWRAGLTGNAPAGRI